MRQFHDHMVKQKRCPSCWRPSTPAEPRDFIAWRKARGAVREHRGRPRKPQEDPMRQALREAVQLLRTEEHDVVKLVSASQRFQNLLDAPPKL